MFLVEFLREFRSWYWNCEFGDPALQEAYDSTGEATTAAEFERSFLTLLRSGDTVARGTALDFFDRAAATSRFGETSPFEAHSEEVFAVAREMLREPPWPEDEHTFEGANHASALLALKNDAGPEDADAVAAVLERKPDGDLRQNALLVAGAALAGATTPHSRLVTLVGSAMFDRSSDRDERLEALYALREAPGSEVTALLVRATSDDDPRIQQEAAWALSSGERFYVHRALVEHLVGTWSGDDRSYVVVAIEEALAEGPHSRYWQECDLEIPELRAAHQELRSPTGEIEHQRAFRLMLHSGHTAAVGIALDHFHHDDGLTRFGLDVEPYVPEVLAVAGDVLRQPPSPAAASPETGGGANHASALQVFEEHAGPDAAEAIAAALRKPDATAVVRGRAVSAASRCLERWEVPDARVVTALEELIFDPAVDVDERTEAVGALFDVRSPQVTAVLVRAAGSAELPIQVEAAVGLTCEHLIDEYRDLLQRLAASWPEDVGRRAQRVRHELS